ncbi:MAG: potassium transporter Kup [Pseudomonadota bacterium]
MATAAHNARTLPLALATLGVVYGDIGTSPLYTMREVFTGPHGILHSVDNMFGILSLILWSLIIIVSIKYVTFVMRADNRGEGGTVALIALASRSLRKGKKKRKRQQLAVAMIGIFGVSFFYGDGMVTPAISVLSAVEGLRVAAPSLGQFVIPLTIVILLALFMIQRSGTARVATFFGPIMAVWFVVLAVLGVVNILEEPAVLHAANPYYALHFLWENSSTAFVTLGAVVLAVTGGEALYADMGHFGRKPIQLAWFVFVLPSLVLNYFGQGALILLNPEALQNPFYHMAPEWALYPLLGLATGATVIASQAVISGAFSLTRQAMQLGYVPRLEVLHTSERTEGQVYVPAVNWFLCVAVIALVLGFQSSSNLAAAYGIAVTGDMVITSLLAIVVVARLWGWGWLRASALFSVFLVIELSFFGANVLKIPDGGWFPILGGIVIFTLMTTWKRGRELLYERVHADAIELEPFIRTLAASRYTRVPGSAVFMIANPYVVPPALLHNLKHNKVVHEQIIVTSVSVTDEPHVAEDQRVQIECMMPKFYRVRVSYGFKDSPDIPKALALCRDRGLFIDAMDTSYFLGRETLIPKIHSDMAFWREKLFISMSRNTSSATNYFKLPTNRVVELGTQVVL